MGLLAVAAVALAGAAAANAADLPTGVVNCGKATKGCHPLTIGVNDDWVSSHFQPAALAFAGDAGIGLLRFPWSWADTQPVDAGDWSWDYTDRIMDNAAAAGEKVLFTPAGSPCWAHPSIPCTVAGGVPPDPGYLPEWQDYIEAVLNHTSDSGTSYADTIVGVEVWNEPNLQPYWAASVDPARYAQLLRATYTAVKAVDPDMPVVYGGLSGATRTIAGTQMDYRAFLRASLAGGAAGYFDALGIHAYASLGSTINNVRNIAKQAGLAGTPIWVTEFGYPSPTPTQEKRQATQIVSALSQLGRTPDVQVAVIHRMFDTGGTSIWDHYGLRRHDGSPKPAYCAVGAWAGSAAC